MKLEIQHIDKLRNGFEKIQTKEDLLALLNDAKKIIWGENTKPYLLKSLSYFSNTKLAKVRYVEFTIKKKSGGDRKINAPVKGLKSIQRSLNLILQCVFEPHKAATGFVPGKSIVDNAQIHTNKNYVYNIDLKDFFPSIDFRRVKSCLELPPFNLNKEISEEREKLAFLIANICCTNLEVERKNENGEFEKKVLSVLPQGAPTSPTLTNIVAQKLDKRLTGLSKRFACSYSRYADDITFSSSHNIYQKNSEFLIELNRIINDQNFSINDKKTRLQKSVYRQEVTGLIVNMKPNVNQRYLKQIRMWIYYWEAYGYTKAEEIFARDYISDKGHVKKSKPNLMNVLDGKLDFLKMVKGETDTTYLKLKERFDQLLNLTESKKLDVDFLENTIEIWEKSGIDTAVKFYENKLKTF